jgi:hypothetical protein
VDTRYFCYVILSADHILVSDDNLREGIWGGQTHLVWADVSSVSRSGPSPAVLPDLIGDS